MEKKTLDDLTPEIKAKIPTYIKNGLEGVFDGMKYRNFDINKAIAAVNWNYEQCGYKPPTVLVAENPKEIFAIYKKLLMEKNQYDESTFSDTCKNFNLHLFTLNVFSQSYYQWFKFIKDEFKLPLSIEKEFEECFTLEKASGIYCGLFLEDYAIVSKYPKKIHRDANNRLHNTTGQAVEWGYSSEDTKFNCYYVHGRNIPEEQYLKAMNDEITINDWLSEPNEDIKAAWYEILGAEKVMSVLGAKEIDSQTITHGDGSEETHVFYKTDVVIPEIEEKLAWVKFVCPSTNTNYLISVNPKWKTVKEAVLDTCPFYGDEIVDNEQYYFTVRG